jgi:hypothetical protein
MTSTQIDWADGTPRPGTRRKLFDAPNVTGFVVSSDGGRFLVTESLSSEAADRSVVLIQNWPALLGK